MPEAAEDGVPGERVTVGLADDDHAAVRSPAQDLQTWVAAAYVEPETRRWPAAVRLAILVIGALAAWAVVAAFVFMLLLR